MSDKKTIFGSLPGLFGGVIDHTR